MELRPLSLEDMEQIRLWRNSIPETTRTPFLLTKEQQQDYYRTVICDRRSTTRYWAVWRDCGDLQPDNQCLHFLGMGGIENIEWENRRGEISILLDPNERGKGYGTEAVEAFLRQAFLHLNLENVWGECYCCSPAVPFWEKMAKKWSAFTTFLPARKYWDGQYYASLYFNFPKNKWIKDV